MAADEHDGSDGGNTQSWRRDGLFEHSEEFPDLTSLLQRPLSTSQEESPPLSPQSMETPSFHTAASSGGDEDVGDARDGLDGSDGSRDDARKHRRDIFTAPKLSLHTGGAEEEIQQPPHESGRQSLGPASRVAPTPASPRSPPLRSPISPRTRDRGFSLRRSLLARSVRQSPEPYGSIIELQPARSSTSQSSLIQHLESGRAGKNFGDSVSVSSVPEKTYDNDTTAESTKKAHVLSSLPHYETWIASKIARGGTLARIRALKDTVRKKILRIHEKPPSKDGRHLGFGFNHKKGFIDDRTGHEHINNTILSTRYTLYNFIPRQLFAQFSKLANFYFLCVSILQMIPGLSTTGTYTTIVPLLFFVTISVAKEGYDDLRRYRLDKAENNRVASVLRACEPPVENACVDNDRCDLSANGSERWAETKWHDIRVGDVVKLCRDEAVPADIAVLQATGTEQVAFIETMALDGETNLKSKQASPLLAKHSRDSGGLFNCNPHLVVEDPNLNLYNFEGKISIEEDISPLTNNDIIYRGSIIRNTAEVVGLVIYTGEECKIRMNATKNPRIKAVCIQPKFRLCK